MALRRFNSGALFGFQEPRVRIGKVFTDTGSEIKDGLRLVLREDGLTLEGDGLSVRGDFNRLLPRISKNRIHSEILVKAAKLKNAGSHPVAFDATAGLGEDSFLLAAAGFHVVLFEYDPVIAALLSDALKRAKEDPALCEIAGRMEFHEGDSIAELKRLADGCFELHDADIPDIILLDPMFPERQKSALVKKKFQLLQRLESPCSDENGLLAAAEAVNPKKIIIKRPAKGPYLAGKKPDYSLRGKAVRYDCFLQKAGRI